jgi:uncharacterized protein involved in response to NO
MNFSSHPLWLVGFRPFFALACLSGVALPVLWALFFSGTLAPPSWPVSPTQWHAHEMFFGFGWAVMGGFLLTSTKNWVKTRGYHGTALMLLVAAWLLERAGMWWAGELPPVLFRLSSNLFLAAIVAMLLWTLIRHHQSDSFRDNYFFLIILPLFLVAKNLLLSADHFQIGASVTLGLFRVAFLVMLERTLSQFMMNALQAEHPAPCGPGPDDQAAGPGAGPASLLPAALASSLALLLALLLSARFCFWKPLLAFRRLDIGIMYLGYLAIVVQLLLESVDRVAQPEWLGSLPMHVFTFGVMGLIIPAMLIRIANGHTGRKVVFDRLDKSVLWIMIAGFVIRIIAPQFFPAGYVYWIEPRRSMLVRVLCHPRMALHPVPLATAGGRQGALSGGVASRWSAAVPPLVFTLISLEFSKTPLYNCGITP